MTAPPGRPLPPAGDLPLDVYQGRACVWCHQLLTVGAVLVGVARETLGVHVLDVEVWACPLHPGGMGQGGRPITPHRR